METRGIRIDQALFGYREGHRLLQASRKFVPTTERSLLTLTDMSGPRMVEGFEEYLSGYQVPGEEAYAVVKTWYAPEMERPGCVWSHALIIQNSDLGAIPDLTQVAGFFKRPRQEDVDYLDSYLRPALASVSDIPSSMTSISTSEAEALLAALYCHSEQPVVIPARDSRSLEAAVLRIWSQQWPGLRVSFRFCTGSLSSRTFAGQTFDLQVVPQKLVSELRRDPTLYITQAIPLGENLPDDAKWVRAAAMDLVGMDQPFRDFAWRYADPREKPRAHYSKLAEMYSFLKSLGPDLSDSDLADIDDQLSRLFPNPKCGRALKQEFFGDARSSHFEGQSISEEARLRHAAHTRNWQHFDAEDLGLRERGRTFWETQPVRRKAVLFDLLDSPTNAIGDEIIAGYAEAIPIPEACDIAKERNGLLLALITRNPRLVMSPEFWQCPIDLQVYYSILDFLGTDRNKTISPAEWIPFLLESGADQLAYSVVEQFPTAVVKAILDTEPLGNRSRWLGPSWRAALSKRQSEFLSFLAREEYRNSTQAMAIMAGFLDPHQLRVRDFGLGPWINLVQKALEVVLAFPNAEAASFILSLGLQYPDKDSVVLVAASFEHVHDAARDDAPEPLAYRAWKFLEVDVPALGFFNSWDRCERLRRALLERFASGRWPRDQFLRCVNRPTTLRSVFYSCREVEGGEDFIRAIAKDVLNNSLPATEYQASEFRSSFRPNRRGKLKLELL
ncbi:MAG: hypothetical protein L0338_04650 [Acidobacteria bacterium]|nr:hypothetical protein [Acidobacteriota bacterium]